MRSVFSFIFLFFLFLNSTSFGFNLKDSFNQTKSKAIQFKNDKFKKKIEPPKEKMVETKAQYDIKAMNVPLEERELPLYQEETSTKDYSYPQAQYIFEQYNYPQGSKEVNIENIKKDLKNIPNFVVDKKFEYGAYVKYFFIPEFNQISSNFYVAKLDTSLDKKTRILNFKENKEERNPIIESGTKTQYKNLYSGLNVVDWDSTSSKILIKEKIGSAINGIYKTYLYVYFMPQGIEKGRLLKLDGLDRAIKYYYLNREDLQIIKYRYDIEPLGFSAENEDIVVANCFILSKEGKKLFLGTWGFDVVQNQAMLFSKTEQTQNINANGLVIKRVLD